MSPAHSAGLVGAHYLVKLRLCSMETSLNEVDREAEEQVENKLNVLTAKVSNTPRGVEDPLVYLEFSVV